MTGSRLLFWLVIKPVSLLPYPLLYRLSDFFYVIFYYLIGYRKKVVYQNLNLCFPDKSKAEIISLQKKFYRHFCDLVLESLKNFSITSEQAQERMEQINVNAINQYFEKGRSVLIAGGHYGNWEWAGPSFSINRLYQLVVIYRPLSNPYFERMMVRMRTRFGTQITEAQQTLRRMIADKGKLTATAFIADQTASPESAYWTTFLNQDTAVFNGPEKLARKFDYPVVYFHVSRPRRGYYELKPELLFEHPGKTTENEILETFTRKLETDILNNPTIWLWSHRRWKHHRNKK